MKTTLNKVMPGELFWVEEGGQAFTQDAWVRLRDEQADGRCTYKDAKGWVGRCLGSREVWIDRDEELEGLDKLVQALSILRRYGNPTHPTACQHDELGVAIEPHKVSEEDVALLGEWGFEPDTDNEEPEMFISTFFGSC